MITSKPSPWLEFLFSFVAVAFLLWLIPLAKALDPDTDRDVHEFSLMVDIEKDRLEDCREALEACRLSCPRED